MNKLNIITLLTFIFYVLPFNFVICDKDLYKILDVKRGATPEQIKKQYRKMTLKYHPDRNRDNKKAKDMFTDVAEANEILSDPKKRRVYDRGGYDAVKTHVEQANQGGGGGGHDPFGGMFGRYDYIY
jgi:DnaJ-class molecular chaperone